MHDIRRLQTTYCRPKPKLKLNPNPNLFRARIRVGLGFSLFFKVWVCGLQSALCIKCHIVPTCDGFEDVIGCFSFWMKGWQLCSPAGNSHPQETAEISHFYASYGNYFHRPNFQDIWAHSFRKSLWPNTFYCLIFTLGKFSQTDFGFCHML